MTSTLPVERLAKRGEGHERKVGKGRRRRDRSVRGAHNRRRRSGDSRWAHGTFSGKTVSKYCVWVETKGDPATHGDLKAYRGYPGMKQLCIVGKKGKTGKGAKGAASTPALRPRRASRVTPEPRDRRATRAPWGSRRLRAPAGLPVQLLGQ